MTQIMFYGCGMENDDTHGDIRHSNSETKRGRELTWAVHPMAAPRSCRVPAERMKGTALLNHQFVVMCLLFMTTGCVRVVTEETKLISAGKNKGRVS